MLVAGYLMLVEDPVLNGDKSKKIIPSLPIIIIKSGEAALHKIVKQFYLDTNFKILANIDT
jgi:hypothetical protein